MRIYTIGFTKKNAETFFELLRRNKISLLLDIRLNNISQLAGFAKGKDLEYFTKAILNIRYNHDVRFAPTKDLMDRFKDGKITWSDCENEFKQIILDRKLEKTVLDEYLNNLDGICLLCSESEPNQCHRRLIAEFIKSKINEEIQIIHL